MSVYRPEERRLVLRLMAYWDDLRDTREYPRHDEIDPGTIGDDWPNCFLVALREPADQSQLSYIGPNLVNDGVPDGPVSVAELPADALIAHALSPLQRMLSKRIPMSIGGEAEIAGEAVLYRSILLPLSDDGRSIDHVLGAANGKRADGDA